MPDELYRSTVTGEARPLMARLGVRDGARIAIIGTFEPAFLDELRGWGAEVVTSHDAGGLDLAFVAADTPEELAPLPTLRTQIRPDGGIWVVSRKGKAATLRDTDVMGAAVAAGLVDNKVVSFSATHTALRVVIRRGDRPR